MRTIITLALILFYTSLLGQDLQIPNTPAFSILDYEPTSVMRPNSTKKLTSDLLNSFDVQGRLVMNIGIEVAPFWLKSRPALSRDEYLNAANKQLFIQTLTLSAATVKDTVTGVNNLGVGFRVQLIQGKLTEQFRAEEAALNELETSMSAIETAADFAGSTITTRQQAIDFIVKTLKQTNASRENIVLISDEAYQIKDRFTDDAASIKAFCAALRESVDARTNALATNVISFSNKRTGFSLELASAGKFITTSGKKAFNRAGIWLNANNYFTDTDAWTLTARFMATTTDTTSYNTDIGLGYIKEGNNFNVAVEGMMRYYTVEIPDLNINGDAITRIERDFTYRLAAQVSYSIVENVSINMSLGKEFDDPTLSGSSFFSVFGLQYALFNRPQGTLRNTN